jgi:transposase InsO family protein
VVNHKKIQRIYREEGLRVRRKKRKQVAQMPREPRPVPERQDERWSMDFIQDTLTDGRCFRALNIVDDFTRSAARPDLLPEACPQPCRHALEERRADSRTQGAARLCSRT